MANDLFDETEYNKVLKSFAEDLTKLKVDEQRTRIKEVCFQSTSLAVKIAVQIIKDIKDINDESNKDNERFLNLCDKGIESLQGLTNEDDLSESETKQAVDVITTILKMANDDQIIMSAVMNGFDGTFTALGLISTTISDYIK